MTITHAVWEKRNLGVDCYEVTINQGDTLSQFMDKRAEFESEYTVVKVPAGMVEFSFFLQSSGYQFIEILTNCHCVGKLPQLTSIQKRISDVVQCSLMNENDVEQVYDKIRASLFNTDRVSLDPFFSQEQGNNRYIGWISDEVKNGASLYKLEYKHQVVGFFAIKKVSDDVFFPFLGGIYPGYQRYGFGTIMLLNEISESTELGAKKIMLSYSSNNREASSMHHAFGCIIDNQYNVFVRHNSL